LTRPEPTINGNCDSWGFILGKKPETHTRQTPITACCSAATQTPSTTYPQKINRRGGRTAFAHRFPGVLSHIVKRTTEPLKESCAFDLDFIEFCPGIPQLG
jgi:hypothetical protein